MSAVSRLRELTTKPATAEHQEEFDKQTGAAADDRSLCLLLSAQLENTLERAIDHAMGEQTDKLRKALYDSDGPLGNFSRKIVIASAIGLLGLISQENFRLMRHVRNAFAHAKVPITFETEEVANVCAGLVRFNIFEPPEEVDQTPHLSPRDRFIAICNETMIRLTRTTGFDVQYTADDGQKKATTGAWLP